MNEQQAFSRLYTQRQKFMKVMIGRADSRYTRVTKVMLSEVAMPGTTQVGIVAELVVMRLDARSPVMTVERVVAKSEPQVTTKKAVMGLYGPLEEAIATERKRQVVR